MPTLPTNHRSLKRILAIKLADLGDLLIVTPALQALRAAHPGAQIDLLVQPSSAHLLRGASYLDRILTFDKSQFDAREAFTNVKRLARTGRFLLELRLARYDAVAFFHHFSTRKGTLEYAILAYATGSPVRVGLDNGRSFFLTHTLPNKGFGAMHEADYWLSVVSLLGADPLGGWKPHIPIDEKDRASVTSLLANEGISHATRLLAIHPGAGAYSRARIWPVASFALVARKLMSAHDATVIILGGPDEVETAARLEGMIGSNKDRVVNLAGRTTIHETAALLEHCHLFVGGDSGPMHIAAAAGTPVVAIFGPSNSAAWGPYTPPGEPNRHVIVSRNDLPCMPCFYRGFSLGLREGCGPRPCLTGLGPGPVIEACVRVLSE